MTEKSEVEQVDLDAIEKLAKAATPGPWEHERREDRITSHGSILGDIDFAEDAAFIAAANPSTVLALIAEAREGRRLKGAFRFLADLPPPMLELVAEGTEPTPENIIAWAKKLGWKGSDV